MSAGIVFRSGWCCSRFLDIYIVSRLFPWASSPSFSVLEGLGFSSQSSPCFFSLCCLALSKLRWRIVAHAFAARPASSLPPDDFPLSPRCCLLLSGLDCPKSVFLSHETHAVPTTILILPILVLCLWGCVAIQCVFVCVCVCVPPCPRLPSSVPTIVR